MSTCWAPGRPYNECAEQRLPHYHWLAALSPRRSEQWMCRADTSWVSPMNGLFRTIFQVDLLHHLDDLCLQGDLTMNVQSRGFPTVIDLKLHLPGDLNNKCAEQILLQCHQWMAFARPSSKWNYHIDWMRSCIQGDLDNVCTKQRLSQCHQWTAFSKPSSLSPGRPEQ